MNPRFCSSLLLALLAALTLFGVDAQVVAPKFAGSSLTAPRHDWPTNGGDWYNRRYSPLNEIDRDNVATLKGRLADAAARLRARHRSIRAKRSRSSTTASLYVVDGRQRRVRASTSTAARSSGRTRRISTPRSRPSCCGWTSRGVALGDGKVYAGQLDGKLVALDQTTGKVVWSRPGRALAGRLHDHGGAALLRRPRHHGLRGRASSASAAASKRSTRRTASSSGRSTRSPAPANSATTRGRRTTTLWRTAARRSGRRRPSTPSSASSTSPPAIPGPDYNGGVRARRQPVLGVDRRDRREDRQIPLALPASASRHLGLRRAESRRAVRLDIDGVMRKGARRRPSKTGWVYILDRTNGKPLVGIDERPVPQEPRQATAATQPYPRRRRVRAASRSTSRPKGSTLVNGGSIFTPFWTDADAREARPRAAARTGRRARTTRKRGYSTSARGDRIGRISRRDVADGAARRPASATSAGNFGALRCRRSACSRRSTCARTSSSGSSTGRSAATAARSRRRGGLVFVGRNDGRLTALDSRDGTKLWEFQTGAGMNSPVERVRARAASSTSLAYSAGNCCAAPRGRQRLAVRARRHARASATRAAVDTEAHEQCEHRSEPGGRRNRLLQFVRLLPRRGRDRRSRRPGVHAGLSADTIQRIVSGGRNQMPAFGNFLDEAAVANVSAWVRELARRAEEKQPN